MLLASKLHDALEQQRFRLHYQPIVSLTNGETAIQHFEILLRLSGAEGTIVPPDSFIPVAERYGLMGAIDRRVIRTALQWCADTVASNGDVEIAINLSSCSLKDDTLPGFLRDALAGSRVVPHQICFEIKEMAALHNLHHASQFLHELKRLGFSLAVDDFGSGRTCFSYLKMLPADYSKIDGSLVEGIIESRIDHAMVAAINEIGHIMGMKTIGEHAHDGAIVSRVRGRCRTRVCLRVNSCPLNELRLRDSLRYATTN
jgi:ammonium transporter, Amt family